MTREQALTLLKKYNQDPFHIRHALTVEGVMREMARSLGYGDEQAHWALVGLLHDIDFEQYPDAHCVKALEIFKTEGVPDDIAHSAASHGYGLTGVDIAPQKQMEKVLFAIDELTGLIYACSLMRPSRSAKDMELKSVMKKYKAPAFAAGCSREVIQKGADMLGWELSDLITRTLEAMRQTEDEVSAQMN